MILQSAILEINLKNIIFNYKYLSSISKSALTGATIKANAYGLGDEVIIKTLYQAGCRFFFVATLSEALNIRKNFKLGYLYILNGINKNEYSNYLFKNKIIPVVNSIKNLEDLKSLKKKINICIHIDTGINRLGIPIDSINNKKLNKYIKVVLVMSHLASADEKRNFYNLSQLKFFKFITKKYFDSNLKSFSNSSGIILGKNFHFNLTRPGIAIYGGHNNTALKKNIKPVIKLQGRVLQIKTINKNQYIGYNQTYYSKKKISIAIIGIGYADGFFRKFAKKGYVYYKNYKFKIIGRISMDTITIDITNHYKFIKIGALVDLINYNNDIEKIAKKYNTISNEILTSISERVKRVYKK